MTLRTCPTCGTEISPAAIAGLCPRCLLQAGLESAPPRAAGVAATVPAAPTPPGGFTPPSLSELSRRFPQLDILELLGKGGMGAVYKARQRGLDRYVALKILPPEIGQDPAFAERFSREARALGKLNHPNIVAVYDFGQVDGLYYFLMEYVDGANLRQAIRAGSVTPTNALPIVGQICDALQFAHDEGIVHRDIKPENILLDKRGRVKIADFGLAKLLGREQADQVLTATHQVMGTLRYMAPEQMEGSKEVDHRADIFSLGVVFYELLTGELPVGRFAPPSKTVGVDVRLDEVVLRALEREPTLRYQQASEVKTRVQAISDLGLASTAIPNLYGREFKSKTEFLGWPLVHVAFGLDARTGKRKIAKGWLAIGDIAFGGIALGGAAVGGVACGGAAAGLFAFGGLSIGLLLAIGGAAFGGVALGGLAVGTFAVGGFALGYFAYGDQVIAVGGSGRLQELNNARLIEQMSPGLTWTLLASPVLFGIVYVVMWLAFWSSRQQDSLPPLPNFQPVEKPDDQTRRQLRLVGRWLIALGILMLVAWIPLLIPGLDYAAGVPGRRMEATWVYPVLTINVIYSLVAGAIACRAGSNLSRLESPGFAWFAIILCMIPLTCIAVIGFPFGLWALYVLSQPEANAVAEEAERLRDKQARAEHGSPRDGHSLWYDLGAILAHFLRDKLTLRIVGGLAMLVYVACLLMFFSMRGGAEWIDGVPKSHYEVGYPSPWYVMVRNPSSHRAEFVLVSWSVLIGALGLLALAASRKLEELRTGKAHSLGWHYGIWGIAAAFILFLSFLTFFPPSGGQMNFPSQPPSPSGSSAPSS